MTTIPGRELDPACIGKPDLDGLNLLHVRGQEQARFTRLDERIYDFSLCRYCGGCSYIGGQEKAHQSAVCLACGAVQCATGETCAICYTGLLSIDPPVARRRQRVITCGYAHCSERAVSTAPRIRYVCAAHLDRARYPKTRYTKGQTVREAIEITYYRNRPLYVWLPYYVPPKWQGYIRDFVREMGITQAGERG